MRKTQLPALKKLFAKALNDKHNLQDMCFTIQEDKQPMLFKRDCVYFTTEPETLLTFQELWDTVNTLRITATRDGDTLGV